MKAPNIDSLGDNQLDFFIKKPTPAVDKEKSAAEGIAKGTEVVDEPKNKTEPSKRIAGSPPRRTSSGKHGYAGGNEVFQERRGGVRDPGDKE